MKRTSNIQDSTSNPERGRQPGRRSPAGPRLFCLLLVAVTAAWGRAAEPLRALMITGGCCHDYEAQKKILSEGISARANVTWTIVHEGKDRTHYVSVYTNAGWAKGFDVVLHNECFGQATNVAFLEGIVQAHRDGGVPAVMLHCSTHSYRFSSSDEWRKLLGVSSYQHGAKHAFEVVNLKPGHPVMTGFPAKWLDHPDELYQLKSTQPDCIPLAKGVSPKEAEQTVVWLNTYGKARVFGTTLGHANETMQDPVFLDLVSRGLLWVCGKLDEQGQPKPGYGGR